MTTAGSFGLACEAARQSVTTARPLLLLEEGKAFASSSSSSSSSRRRRSNHKSKSQKHGPRKLAYRGDFLDYGELFCQLFLVLDLTRLDVRPNGFAITGQGTLHRGGASSNDKAVHPATPFSIRIKEGFLSDSGYFYWIEQHYEIMNDVAKSNNDKMVSECLVRGRFTNDLDKIEHASRLAQANLFETSFSSLEQTPLFSMTTSAKTSTNTPRHVVSGGALEDAVVVCHVEKTAPTESPLGISMKQATSGGPVYISKLRPGTVMGDNPQLTVGMAVAFIQNQPIVNLHQAMDLLRSASRFVTVVAIAEPTAFWYERLMVKGGLQAVVTLYKDSVDQRTGIFFRKQQPMDRQQNNAGGDPLIVDKVRPDSLACRAGVEKGMQVLSINQYSRFKTTDQAIERIHNTVGPVTLMVLQRPLSLLPEPHESSSSSGVGWQAAGLVTEAALDLSFFGFLGC